MTIGMRTISVPIFVIKCDGEDCKAELSAFSREELQELVDGHSWRSWVRPERNFTTDMAGNLQIGYHVCSECDSRLQDDPEWLKATRHGLKIVGTFYVGDVR